ncbi:MAG: hypothetical protein JXA33_28210 [Anaerolineae bacterium]|nr:hypothetical protein [Anaerolineae bacterium]
MIEKYLDDLERRIDIQEEDTLWGAWRAFVDGEFRGDIFSPRRARQSPPGLEWPRVPINDALEDYDLMALHQFETCSRMLAEGTGALMCVRCNYGTGIMPTLFGADLFVMDKAMDTLPTSIPLGGIEIATAHDAIQSTHTSPAVSAVKALLDRGVPDLHNGLGGKVLAMGEHYQTLMQSYPLICRYVPIYHPDMQGPMDICELLWGSGLFVALIEVPDLVLQLLELVTETYIQFMRAWTEIVPFVGEYAVHWSMLHKGNIMLRDDSAMNLSPRMFDTFIKPYDARLLDEFGGGGIHFCGRGDHYIKRASEIKNLTTVNLSQPEYNDMERIFAHTVDKGIPIVGLKKVAAEAALAGGRDLHGRVHCW